jgi:hypothetical protein
MCLLISLESWRHVLDLLSHTVERYGILIFTNAILGSSLVAGILLLPAIGVFALPAANCAGLLIGNLVVVWWLSSTGFPFKHDLRMIIGAAVAAICSIAVTLLSRPYIDSWMVQVALGVFVYIGIGVAVLRPRERERDLWSRLLVAGRG